MGSARDGTEPTVVLRYLAWHFFDTAFGNEELQIHLVNNTAFAGVATRKSAMILSVIARSPACAFTNPSRSRQMDFITKSNYSRRGTSILNW
jgi:hypothetical protein